jgi:hypothetical protein
LGQLALAGQAWARLANSEICFFVQKLILAPKTYKIGWDLDILNKIKSKQLFT